jgi:hypothetical protein
MILYDNINDELGPSCAYSPLRMGRTIGVVRREAQLGSWGSRVRLLVARDSASWYKPSNANPEGIGRAGIYGDLRREL